MNTQSVEHVSMALWVGISCWLGFLAFRSRRYSKLRLKPILWAAFLLFTFLWLPASPAGYGVIAFPLSLTWIEAAVAFPVYDGSPRFHGIPPPQLSTVVAGYAALVVISTVALISFRFAADKTDDTKA